MNTIKILVFAGSVLFCFSAFSKIKYMFNLSNVRYDSFDILNSSNAKIISGLNPQVGISYDVEFKSNWIFGVKAEIQYQDFLPDESFRPINNNKKYLTSVGFELAKITKMGNFRLRPVISERIFFTFSNGVDRGIDVNSVNISEVTFRYESPAFKNKVYSLIELSYLDKSDDFILAGYGGKLGIGLAISNKKIELYFQQKSQDSFIEIQKTTAAGLSFQF